MFKKKGLEVGMIAEFRDGTKFMVMPTVNGIVMINGKGEYVELSRYNEMLVCESHKNLDVMKVWGLSWATPDVFITEERNRELLWQREEPKYHVVLPLGTFGESDKYLKYDIEGKSYFFGTDYQPEPNEFGNGVKTKFTLEEANEIKNIIKSSIEVVEIKGGQ